MRYLIIPLLCIGLQTHCQVSDDFADGDYQNNPAWDGDTLKFEVDTSFRLHLNAPAVTDVAYLSTQNVSVSNAVWEFYLELGFNPSASNYAKVYVVADQSDLLGSLNGYFVKIGNSSDEVSLYRQDGLLETEIIDGVDGRLGSSFVAVRIRVTRDSTGFWTLSTDSTGGNNFQPEGSVSDNSYFQTGFFGIACTYTSTRSKKFWFDDFQVSGQPYVDSIPPAIQLLKAVSNTQLDVRFTEPVDQITAEVPANYFADNGIGMPVSATLDFNDSSVVHLSFSNPFGNSVYNMLTVSNVADVNNNIMGYDSAVFLWFVPVDPESRSVVINEIFADPSPQLGLPPNEFIELYNPDTNTYDLKNWQFTDGTSIGIIPSFILLPQAYVILCSISDTGTFSIYGDVLGLQNWPTLNNAADSISISDSSGFTVDLVPYTDDWYKDAGKSNGGWTLEQINPQHPCSGEFNWQASVDPSGGTPGWPNSVFDTTADTQPPVIEQVIVLNLYKLYVTFNETMDANSLSAANYLIDHNINVTQVIPGVFGQSITLYLSPALDSLTTYTLQINGATDCSGNALTDGKKFGIGTEPALFDLLISEMMADPDPAINLPDKEYVELYNTTNHPVRLQGCLFTDGKDTVQTGDYLILPFDYLILCDAGDEQQFAVYGNTDGINGFPSLNNASDHLELLAPDSTLIHGVTYSADWYGEDSKSDGGWSLEMIDPSNPCAGSFNWRASTDPSGGTPGRINSINGNNPDLTPPRLIRADAWDAFHVLLTFSEPLLKSDMASATYSIDHGISVSKTEWYDTDKAQLTLASQLNAGLTYTVEVSDLFDCVGNQLTDNTATFGLPEYPGPGELIINEVLFNPRGSGSDFVELYNNSDQYINLQNWLIAAFDTLIDSISNPKQIIAIPFEMAPETYLLLCTDAENIITEYPLGKSDRFLELNALPPYNNAEGIVVLADSSSVVFDRFDYNENMHYPLLNDVEGVSLERIDFNRPTNDATNWHSAAQTVGFATPGYKNSQYKEEGGSESGINVQPEVFSPDNDGQDDVLTISYHFDQPGFIANLIIFDVRGRQVKTLVQNTLLGTEGAFNWDGMNDEREKAPTGIYIIFFEAYNQNGVVKRFKEKCVLATKL